MTIFNVFSLLGGLALFLFGMDIMGKALEKQAGGQLQKILSKLTDNPLKGFFLGLCVTAVIQSSSATTVMVVGFVNSGIMELHQAIGVIMGSNVGTTVTRHGSPACSPASPTPCWAFWWAHWSPASSRAPAPAWASCRR